MLATHHRTASEKSEPVVTRIKANVELQAPPGCSASVLLRQVTRVGPADGPGQRTFAWWLAVGRFQVKAITVPFVFDGVDTLRVDVPEGTSLDTDTLQTALAMFVKGDDHLPEDTVVIKK